MLVRLIIVEGVIIICILCCFISDILFSNHDELTTIPTPTSQPTKSPTNTFVVLLPSDTSTFTPQPPTINPRTETVEALFTYAAETQTQAASSPTSSETTPPTDTPITPLPVTAGKVEIVYIGYNGIVKQVESDEYILIMNTGGSSVNITGWRIYADDPGQNFYFPSFVLQPGQKCRVYTNEIHPETCGFSFGINTAIWNNDGECGTLYDDNGVLVDEYCY